MPRGLSPGAIYTVDLLCRFFVPALRCSFVRSPEAPGRCWNIETASHRDNGVSPFAPFRLPPLYAENSGGKNRQRPATLRRTFNAIKRVRLKLLKILVRTCDKVFRLYSQVISWQINFLYDSDNISLTLRTLFDQRNIYLFRYKTKFIYLFRCRMKS